jgi:hypothetical protein
LQESGKDYVLQTYLDQLPADNGASTVTAAAAASDSDDGGLSVSPKSTRNKDSAKSHSAGASNKIPGEQVQVEF